MHAFTSHRDRTRRYFASFYLPDNPVCWLLGHKAKVEVIDSKFASIESWVKITCRVCGRRYNPPADLYALRGETPLEQSLRAKERLAARVEFARRDPAAVARSASGRDGYSRAKADFHLELAQQSWRIASAQFHLGSADSENTVKANVYVPGFCAHAGFGGILRRTGAWLGGGHKRDLEVAISGAGDGPRQLEWKLWYDDDGGNDDHHRAKCRANPRSGRRLCLRRGYVALNPVTFLWGSKSYHYEDASPPVDVVLNIGQFPHDHYPVTFTLQREVYHRDRGPAWVRRAGEPTWSASWRTPGIPYRNHDWKGDDVLGSSERVPVETVEDGTWVAAAMESLAARIVKDRRRYGYVPPKAAYEA